jgi:hypothetical protein
MRALFTLRLQPKCFQKDRLKVPPTSALTPRIHRFDNHRCPHPSSGVIDTIRNFCVIAPGAAPFPVTALFKLAMCVAQSLHSPCLRKALMAAADAMCMSLEWSEEELLARQNVYVESEIKQARRSVLPHTSSGSISIFDIFVALCRITAPPTGS